jgi:hypothetical protein
MIIRFINTKSTIIWNEPNVCVVITPCMISSLWMYSEYGDDGTGTVGTIWRLNLS